MLCSTDVLRVCDSDSFGLAFEFNFAGENETGATDFFDVGGINFVEEDAAECSEFTRLDVAPVRVGRGRSGPASLSERASGAAGGADDC